MFVLGLITCVVLTAFSAHAKVVDSFEECKEFFYKGIEPRGMDQNAKKICQKWENGSFYYATLYSVYHKIPLYSAYTLDPKCSSSRGRIKQWHLEPQLSQHESQLDYMVHVKPNNQSAYKENQAISSDYIKTGYDRGHLNPSCFQCSDGRKATFTLTNAAPMNRHFNQIPWNKCESTLRVYLTQQLARDGGFATAYIVTGTVPDPNVRIPQREVSKDPERVTVPSHIWTAVCYKQDPDNTNSFSFGYIGRNRQNEPDIKLMSVSDLNSQLSKLYSKLSGAHQSIEIFADDCFGDNNKLNKVMEVFKKLINLPVNLAVEMSSGINDTYLAVESTFNIDSTPEENVKQNESTGKIAFDSMSTYYDVAEHLKVFAGNVCVITNVEPRTIVHDELRNREVSTGPDAVECLLVPERKTAADGSLCSSVSESDYSCQCDTGKKTKPCCSTPCLYMDKLNGYRCYSDQKLIECSPPYSLITYKTERCLDDYPCATYGRDYYWCRTSYNAVISDFEWDYCSPPLRNSKAKNGKYCRINNACAKYGCRYKWCYTDDEDNWDYC
ncbi:uncharacterized protein [Garra rufa]|uniref:uncharacterized protein n=1 Tax=Garra rufa TaxID=137080 RepID=UPI003CCEDF75